MGGNLESPQTGILPQKDLPSGGKTILHPLSSTASGFQLCCGKETGSASPRGRLWSRSLILPLMSSGTLGGLLVPGHLDFLGGYEIKVKWCMLKSLAWWLAHSRPSLNTPSSILLFLPTYQRRVEQWRRGRKGARRGVGAGVGAAGVDREQGRILDSTAQQQNTQHGGPWRVCA